MEVPAAAGMTTYSANPVMSQHSPSLADKHVILYPLLDRALPLVTYEGLAVAGYLIESCPTGKASRNLRLLEFNFPSPFIFGPV